MRKQRLVLGAEDVAEQTSSGYVQHTSAESEKYEHKQPPVGKDVSMARLHRHNPGLGVVFFRLRPDCDTVLFMFSLLFFYPAVIRKQWAREQHANR